jgi:septum formation protein
MDNDHFSKYQIILASKSPRRHYLLKELGIHFDVQAKEVDESFPADLIGQEIPLYLCRKKADAFLGMKENSIVITADTIVWINGQALNKPRDHEEAAEMLRTLSGKCHEVFTGVCLKSKLKTVSFFSRTKVFFKILSGSEIEYYITNYKPYDKAGGYGAQEWIGYIGIERIEGSYFNVMGLPLKELYEHLITFVNQEINSP